MFLLTLAITIIKMVILSQYSLNKESQYIPITAQTKDGSCDIKTLSLLTLNLTHLDRNENTDYVCIVM